MGVRDRLEYAHELTTNARESDVPCRYGGDEFLVLLDGTDSKSAENAAERLRGRIAATPVAYGADCIHTTISVGVATVAGGGPVDLNDLIERADRALYKAKETGRNKVVVDRIAASAR
jgi:two-component system cell cycle response regulator